MQIRHLTALLAAAGTLLALNVSVLAQQRVALVIGNAIYEHAPRLANPLNDAQDVGAALARLGFAVTRLENVNYAELRRGLLAFTRAASAAEVVVVFYAGHGIEVDQRNFLVPVDARLSSDQDVEFETVPLALVMRSVSRASGLRLVILDACRENPFAVSMQRSGATRSIGRGLARVEPAGETLVAYAAKEGTVAADGEGRNSPYSQALLAHLEEPGLEIGLLFRKVRDAVLASTGGRQEPFVYGSLSSRGVYLTARVETLPVSEPEDKPAEGNAATDRLTAEQLAAKRLAGERELLFWESVKDSTNPADLQAYLNRYPGGTYEVLARNRLEALQPSDTPEVVPESTSETVEAGLELSRADRRLIQLGLAAAGFDPGGADGLFGRKTRGAIGRWQASRDEEATGHLDAESAKALLAGGRAHEQATARRMREQEARESAQREAQERARREAEERARREAVEAERRRQREPGRRFRDCDACPEMVVVPAGTFVMGSPSGEEGRYDNEGPQHRVTIAEPFAVGVYEVTRGEFARFARSTGHSAGNSCRVFEYGMWTADTGEEMYISSQVNKSGANWRNPGYEHTAAHPVVCISWDDAHAYIRWLSAKTGAEYRLLSESEWEYVARAGTRTARYWGQGESGQCRHANGSDLTAQRRGLDTSWEAWDSWSFADSTVAACEDGSLQTSPVGSFRANGFGLYDVLGNANEWVGDCWNDGYRGAPVDGGAWQSGNCEGRVLRGGSWADGPTTLRAAFRMGVLTGSRVSFAGFRVARTLIP